MSVETLVHGPCIDASVAQNIGIADAVGHLPPVASAVRGRVDAQPTPVYGAAPHPLSLSPAREPARAWSHADMRLSDELEQFVVALNSPALDCGRRCGS